METHYHSSTAAYTQHLTAELGKDISDISNRYVESHGTALTRTMIADWLGTHGYPGVSAHDVDDTLGYVHPEAHQSYITRMGLQDFVRKFRNEKKPELSPHMPSGGFPRYHL